MRDISFRLADEGNWSGGGRVFLANYRSAARDFPLLSGGSSTPVDLIPRNVPVRGLRQRRPYVLAPQNAWPWAPIIRGARDLARVASLRVASELSLRRSAAVLRISSSIPVRPGGVWSPVVHNVLDEGFDLDVDQAEQERVVGAEGAIVSIGSINAYRGFDALCEAHRAIGEAGTRPPLFIAGTPSNPKLAARIRERFAAPDVTIHLGALRRPECLAAYRDAALVVLPSWVEASPLTALEAAATTSRLVLSDIPGHREILADYGSRGATGWFEARDPDDLARRLVSGPGDAFEDAHRMLANAGTRSSARRSWGEQVHAWLTDVAEELETRR